MTDYGHDIEKYLKGELTHAERHALEKKALNDPFLAEALEGAEQIKPSEFFKDVAQLNERIVGKKSVSVWVWTARIAAGLALLLVSTFIVWSVMEPEPPQDLAKNEQAAPPAISDSSTSAAEILSSPPIEQPTAGPTISDKKDVAKKPGSLLKTETKPKGTTGEPEAKKQPVTEPIEIAKAEEKVDELKASESLALTKSEKEAESSRAKAVDDVRNERIIDTKKKAASDKDASPAAAGSRAVAPTAPKNVIQGQVTFAENGSPLPGVNVLLKNSTIGTTTDAAGNYQVKVDDSNPTLVYSSIGMQTTEVKVNDRQEVNVAMQSDATQLSEVVNSGYGVRSAGESVPPTVNLAHPEIGNRAYNQYLEKNIRYPEQAKANKVVGRVTVEFTIEPNGTLTNFTIIRGIGSGCDEELIRLIKEGPTWIPTKKDNVPVLDKSKIRLKFELPR